MGGQENLHLAADETGITFPFTASPQTRPAGTVACDRRRHGPSRRNPIFRPDRNVSRPGGFARPPSAGNGLSGGADRYLWSLRTHARRQGQANDDRRRNVLPHARLRPRPQPGKAGIRVRERKRLATRELHAGTAICRFFYAEVLKVPRNLLTFVWLFAGTVPAPTARNRPGNAGLPKGRTGAESGVFLLVPRDDGRGKRNVPQRM